MRTSNVEIERGLPSNPEAGAEHHDGADVSRERARGWVIAFFVTALCLCSTIALLNFVVNPYGDYPGHRFPPLTWSSRQVKVELLRTQRAPEVLILGSSRAMKVPPQEIQRITGKRAFNASVDSARAEDWFAIYSYTRDALGIRVSELVLGIDIEAFRDHLEPDGRLLATPELRPYVPLSMRLQWYARSAQSLLSYVQLVDSVRSLHFSMTAYPAAPQSYDPDGVLHYVEWERQIASGTFHARLEPPFDEYRARFKGFDALDSQRKAIFEELLEQAERDGARIRAFITPLHWRLVDDLRATRHFDELRNLTIEYLRGVQARFPRFSVIDFTDVKTFGGDPAGFLDAAHTDEENSRRMTAALWTSHALQ